jgi:hypothetical protein
MLTKTYRDGAVQMNIRYHLVANAQSVAEGAERGPRALWSTVMNKTLRSNEFSPRWPYQRSVRQRP